MSAPLEIPPEIKGVQELNFIGRISVEIFTEEWTI